MCKYVQVCASMLTDGSNKYVHGNTKLFLKYQKALNLTSHTYPVMDPMSIDLPRILIQLHYETSYKKAWEKEH